MLTIDQAIKQLEHYRDLHGGETPVYVYADHGQLDMMAQVVEEGKTSNYHWMIDDDDNDDDGALPYVCIVNT